MSWSRMVKKTCETCKRKVFHLVRQDNGYLEYKCIACDFISGGETCD